MTDAPGPGPVPLERVFEGGSGQTLASIRSSRVKKDTSSESSSAAKKNFSRWGRRREMSDTKKERGKEGERTKNISS